MNVSASRIFILVTILIVSGSSNIVAQKNVGKNNPPAKASSKTQYIHSALELDVFQEINQARTEPQNYIAYLEDYKKATKGNVRSLPKKIPVRMTEGVSVIEEAITDLRQTSNLKTYEISEKLSRTARMQLSDLQENPSLGHIGKNGSTLKTRLSHFCKVEGKAGENICFRGSEAREVVLAFIIDDGVKSRTHRKNILSPHFRNIGVACGNGKDKEMLCVIVFADKVKDLNSASSVVEY